MNARTLFISIVLFLLPNNAQSMEIVVQKSNMPRRFLHAKVTQLEALFTQNPEADWGDAQGYPYDKTTMYALWFNHALANMRNTKFIQAFITRGVDANRPLRFEGNKSTLVAPLAVAVMARTDNRLLYEPYYLSNIEFLLNHGATFCQNTQLLNLSYILNRLNSAFNYFRESNELQMEERIKTAVDRLLKLGCPIQGVEGQEPPLKATGLPLVMEILLQHGADPLQPYKGTTILQSIRDDLACTTPRKIGPLTPRSQEGQDRLDACIALLEAKAERKRIAKEDLPKLGQDSKSHFAKLPAEIRAIVGNYFAW